MTERLLAATDDGCVTLKRDAGAWREHGRALGGQEITCVASCRGTLLAGTTRGLYLSEDGGESWGPSGEGLTIPHMRWLLLHPGVPGLGFAGTEPAGIFVTADDGRTWRGCPEVAKLRDENGWYLPYSPEAGCVRGFAAHGRRVYAAVEQGGALRSDDAGETWRLCPGSTGKVEKRPPPVIHPDVHSIEVHGTSPDLVFAPTGGGFYRSADGGRKWELLYECYCRAVWVDPKDPARMVLGPADGVSKNGRIEQTVDAGVSWSPASEGLDVPWPEHMVGRFLAVGGELMAVLSNGGLIMADLGDLRWRAALPDLPPVNAVCAIRGYEG